MPNDLVIVWRVTEQCNLGCRFCSYDRRLERSRQTIDPQTVLAFGKLLREYQHQYRRTILVSWMGGEPFLWPSLGAVSRIFKTEFNLRVAVTTNGLALSRPHMREQIIELFDHLVLSIDGLAEFHDHVRDRPGTFNQLKENVRALCELREAGQSTLWVGVNTILMHDNIGEFESLCDELAAWGIQEITFNTLGGRDRPEFFPAHRLTPEDVAWFRAKSPQIRRQASQRGLTIRGRGSYLERIAFLARDQPMAVQDCNPGSQFWFIDENGLVAPCNFTVNGYGIPIQLLRDTDDLHRLPALFAARKRNAMLAPCFDCKSTQVFGKFESEVVNGTRGTGT